MHQPARDGTFNAIVTNPVDGLISPDRTLITDNVVITDSAIVSAIATAAQAVAPPANVPYPKYTLAFTSVDTTTVPGTTTVIYNITETPPVSGGTTPAIVSPVTNSYPTGTSIKVPDAANFITPGETGIPGLAFTITGTPKLGDTVTIDSSPSIFSVMDDAIRDIGVAVNNNASTQAVSQALHNIDIGMERVSNVRGQAGELLNRADRISGNQEKRSIQMEDNRSRAEDLDMVKGISDFQNQQTGYSAALQTYAQIQKLSLFNFIS